MKKNNIFIIFRINRNNKIYELKKLHGTFAFVIYNKVLNTAKSYYLQFSTKDMWLIPTKRKVNKNTILYGWLFIYFGYDIQ